jgi:hypothetical protein
MEESCMHKKLGILFVFVLLVAASVSAQETVRCESTDGRYRECEIGGIGRVTLTRQISDKGCVEGKSWGYRDGVVWVTDGCRAEFGLAQRGFQARSGGRVVVCESQDGKRKNCGTDTRAGVAVVQQLSRNSCVQGQTWGYDANGIWVDEGCRAQFVIGGTRTDPGPAMARLDELVTCESIDGRTARCAADTTAGVQVVRQISNSDCDFGTGWGYDENGIWVANGCRAEFAVRGPMQARAVIQTTTPAVSTPVNVSMTRSEPETVTHTHTHATTTHTTHVASDRTPGTLLCESENNGRKHCDTDTRWGISLVRQISDNICIRDRTWGVDKDGVWVNDGCRAEFTIGHNAPAVAMTSSAVMPNVVICESIDGRRANCEVDTTMGVRLYRQLSDSDCLLNSTWGVDATGIWVSGGCRAEFAAGDGRNMPIRNAPQSARVTCESKDNKRAVCPADTRLGVAVVRQTSDAPCILNSTWGYNSDGIWVTAGCRAEFIMRR